MTKKRKTAVSIIIVILIFIFLHFVGILRPIENGIRGAVNSFSGVIFKSTQGLGNVGTFFTSKRKMQEELDQTKTNIEDLSVDIAKLELLQKENLELREQLNFLDNSNLEHIGADVVGRSIDPIGTTIVLNRGGKHGVELFNPVIVGKGILIGKTIRVDSNTSIVRLINDSQSRIASTILNKDNSIGVVEGGYGLSIRMNFIPQNEVVNPGDLIVSSGLQSEIPRGLLIGSVEVLEKQTQNAFQEAILRPAADLGDITHVSIIKKQD